MKRKILTTVALLLSFGAAFAWFAGIDGKWSAMLKGPDGNEFPISYTFKTDGATLTGTLTSSIGTFDKLRLESSLSRSKTPSSGSASRSRTAPSPAHSRSASASCLVSSSTHVTFNAQSSLLWRTGTTIPKYPCQGAPSISRSHKPQYLSIFPGSALSQSAPASPRSAITPEPNAAGIFISLTRASLWMPGLVSHAC